MLSKKLLLHLNYECVQDLALIERRTFKEFWKRDVEESVRQKNAKPFVEEAILQVSNWGFSIADLSGSNKHKGRGVLAWLKSLYSPSEKRWSGFLGPIHLWQVSKLHIAMHFMYYTNIDFFFHKYEYFLAERITTESI